MISVLYFDQPICGSPFTAKAWNASAVTVSGMKAGCIGKLVTFNGKLMICVLATVQSICVNPVSHHFNSANEVNL